MRIRGRKKIDKIGLIRLGRRFNVPAMFIDQLKRGEVVDLPDEKAEAMVSRGYAVEVSARVEIGPVTMDDRDVETESTVEVVDAGEEGDVPFEDESIAPEEELREDESSEKEEDPSERKEFSGIDTEIET